LKRSLLVVVVVVLVVWMHLKFGSAQVAVVVDKQNQVLSL
jgi:hypothetical protein